jgi:hypothetical protein
MCGRMHSNDIELPPAVLLLLRIKGALFLVKKDEKDPFWTLPGGKVSESFRSLTDFALSSLDSYFDGLSIDSMRHIATTREKIEFESDFLPCSLFHCKIHGIPKVTANKISYFAQYCPPSQVLSPEARGFVDHDAVAAIFTTEKTQSHP